MKLQVLQRYYTFLEHLRHATVVRQERKYFLWEHRNATDRELSDMPHYEYRCEANGRTLEVRHGMDERLETWGELANRAGTDPGPTPLEARVERLLSVPVPLTSSRPQADSGFQRCGSGCACVPQS